MKNKEYRLFFLLKKEECKNAKRNADQKNGFKRTERTCEKEKINLWIGEEKESKQSGRKLKKIMPRLMLKNRSQRRLQNA